MAVTSERHTGLLTDRQTGLQESDTDIQNMYLFLTEDRSDPSDMATCRTAGGFCRSVRVKERPGKTAQLGAS